MTSILYRDERYTIVNALFEVYNNLGSGFLEIDKLKGPRIHEYFLVLTRMSKSEF